MSMKNKRNRRRNPERTMLLICCSKEEAESIRAAAQRERRTISGFIMSAVSNRLEVERRLQERREHLKSLRGAVPPPVPPAAP